MALIAHRMMLKKRTRPIHQQLARNKVGVLIVPTLAEFYNETEMQQQRQLQQLQELEELQCTCKQQGEDVSVYKKKYR